LTAAGVMRGRAFAARIPLVEATQTARQRASTGVSFRGRQAGARTHRAILREIAHQSLEHGVEVARWHGGGQVVAPAGFGARHPGNTSRITRTEPAGPLAFTAATAAEPRLMPYIAHLRFGVLALGRPARPPDGCRRQRRPRLRGLSGAKGNGGHKGCKERCTETDHSEPHPGAALALAYLLRFVGLGHAAPPIFGRAGARKSRVGSFT
jgi:hypothetical protein